MRKSMKKLALSRETLHNMGLKDVTGGAIGTWNCTHLCSHACSGGCPSDTGITGDCSNVCNPTVGCATEFC